MALTGFNPGQINASISSIDAAYTILANALSNGSGQQLVSQMQDKWVCQEAIDFFTLYKSSLDNMLNDITEVFLSVVSVMNNAAINWAERTGNAGAYSQRNLVPREERVQIDAIQENINDTRGIDMESAESTFNSALTQVFDSLNRGTTTALNAVDSCGFIGGSQQENLIGLLTQIKNKIENTFSVLQESFNHAMRTTLLNYGALESSISNSFSGNGGISHLI